MQPRVSFCFQSLSNWAKRQIHRTNYTDPNFSGTRDAKKLTLGLDPDCNDQANESRDRVEKTQTKWGKGPM